MNADLPERDAHRRPLREWLSGAGFLLWFALAALIFQRCPPASWEHEVRDWCDLVLEWCELMVPMVGFIILALLGRLWRGETLYPGAALLEVATAFFTVGTDV